MTLLAAWNFDEASGNFLDVTGNGHDWAPGAGITRQTGHTNTGARHESTAADSPGPAIFGQTANRTLSCWVKRSSNSVDGWIVEMKNGSAGTGVCGFLFSGSSVQARVKNASNTAFTASFAQPTVNVWYHLAMTYDGTNIRLYFDGVLKATTAFTGPIWTSATIFPFFDTVGSETVIDDVRIYDHAQTAAEILTDKDTPVAAASTTTGTLTASFSSPTVAATGSASADAALSASFSSPTVDAAANGSASGVLSGAFSSSVVAGTVDGSASGAIDGTFSSPDSAYSAAGIGTGVLDGSFASPVFSADGSSAEVNAGELNGSFSSPDATFSVLSEVDVSMIGTFSIPVFAATGGVPMSDRDILVTIGPGERPATSIVAGPARVSIAVDDFQRTKIGA